MGEEKGLKLPIIVTIAVIMILVVAVLPAINFGVNGGNNWSLTSAIAYLNASNYTAWATGSLTAGGIPIAQVDGSLATDSGLTYNSTTDTLSATNLTAPTGRTATYVIAASNATEQEKAQADVVCDGTADNIIIQNIIDAAPINSYIGFSTGEYHFSNCIKPKAGMTLNCEGAIFTLDNAVTSLLTSNANSGQSNITVADGSLFYIGQWVAVTDSAASTLVKGSATFFLANCSTIVNITGNVITLDDNLSVSYTTANSAYVTTASSIVLIDSSDNVTIVGGEWDGNKANQSLIETISLSYAGEEVRAACGIVVYNSDHVTLEGAKLHDAELHNISCYLSDYTTIKGNQSYSAYFKNIFAASCVSDTIINNYAFNSVWEDGIILYASCPTSIISNNYSWGNYRNQIRIGSGNDNTILIGNHILSVPVNSYGISTENANNITIMGGSINSSNLTNYPLSIVTSTKINIIGVTIIAGYNGLYITNSSYCTISNINIYRSGTPGTALLVFNGTSTKNIVRGGVLDNVNAALGGAKGVYFGLSGSDTANNNIVDGVTIYRSILGVQTITIGINNVVQNCTFDTVTTISSGFTTTKFINNNGYIAPSEIRTISGTMTTGAGNAANAFAFAWQNPEAQAITVLEIMVDITTAGGTATSIMDIGTGATATTASNNLINDLDLNATGITISTARLKMDANGGTTDFITGQILTEKADNLVAKYYIKYIGQ